MITKKRLTLEDIARLAGVSKTTASMVLNGKSEDFRLKPETRERVKAVAKQYGYRANAYARALQARRSNVVGLVVPDLTNYGFAQTAKTLERLCRENGLYLLIGCSDDNPATEKEVIERLLDRQVDVLITAPTQQDPAHYAGLFKDTAMFQLDRYIEGLPFPSITSRDTPSIAELVENIVRANELNEFYYFGGQLSLSPSINRLKGFKEGLEQGHLTLQNEWILHLDYQPHSGYKMLAQVVQQLGRLPQAIFTASFTLLEGVLRYLSEHNLMDHLLDKRLHLATFDDHDLLNALPFPIHSIKQQHEQLANAVFQLILQQRERGKVESQHIDCEIIWRKK